MGKELLDASIGLAFSLAAFERYQKTGILQAELHHVPGIHGRCQGYLQVTQGKVVSCHIEDKNGQRHTTQLRILLQLDEERGPFSWVFAEAPPLIEQTTMQPQHTPGMSTSISPIPKIVALLNLDELHGWRPAHKQILFQVYQAINSRRNVEDIKQELSLPPYIIEEALHVLLTLNVITLT